MKDLYKKIESSITTTTPELDYYEIMQALIDLCELIKNEPEDSEWIYIEGNYGSLPDLIIGAFWHFTEWHQGQYHKSYETLCALGSIYEPNMADSPEPESCEQDIYEMLNQLAEEDSNQ